MGEVSLSFFSILLDFFNGKLDKDHSLLLCLLRLSIYKYRPFIKNQEEKYLFRGIVLVIRVENITFANEKSVLLISAEHCKI